MVTLRISARAINCFILYSIWSGFGIEEQHCVGCNPFELAELRGHFFAEQPYRALDHLRGHVPHTHAEVELG